MRSNMDVGHDAVRIRLLGPVTVTVNGRAQPLSGVRRKTILAMLALHVGRTVNTEWLIDVVWDGCPPATVVNTLQAHVSALRRALDGAYPIVARPPGYVLEAPGDIVDIVLAERLIADSLGSGDHAGNAARLRQAIGMWHGHALSDVRTSEWLHARSFRLDSLRDDAIEALIEDRLALGEHAQVIAELRQLTDDHPYRETVHRQLMLALYRCRRQADALAVYRRHRQTIGDELGLDPSAELRELETAILRQDPDLDVFAPMASAA